MTVHQAGTSGSRLPDDLVEVHEHMAKVRDCRVSLAENPFLISE
jgi:hypothetical protein